MMSGGAGMPGMMPPQQAQAGQFGNAQVNDYMFLCSYEIELLCENVVLTGV